MPNLEVSVEGRDLVWKAWTDPRHVAQWWGPSGFTNTIHAMDVRPDGEWRFFMHGPDGTDHPNRIRYTEVRRPERLVFVVSFSDPEGRTTLHMRSTPIHASAEECEVFAKGFPSMQQGFKGTLDQLEAYLATL